MKLRKILSLLVALVMMVQVLPLSLFANDMEGVTEYTFSESIAVDTSSLADNDELLTGYVEQLFGVGSNSGIMLTATYTGEDALSGICLNIYRQLRAGVEKIASGEESSSVITVSFTYTFEELGTDNVADAMAVLDEDLSVENFELAIDYLIADCPYEMY